MAADDSKPGPDAADSQNVSELVDRLRGSTQERTGSAGEGAGRIGRYEVVEEIARGGMGVIFQVRDREMRRGLAMKVLRGETIGEQASLTALDSQRMSRFLDEAQVTGQLEHPGIIPVHEMGLDEEGRLFFTMQLVKGITLGEVIANVHAADESWSLTRALGVILKVCEAMAFAHDKNVIHRDLKPANVMVGRFGETYVMDWGLAKVLDGTEQERESATPDASVLSVLRTTRKDDSGRTPETSTDTMEGDVVGTPSYMPPEQATGRLEQMGPRSDVYSVGAMLYHLLAGRAPFTSAGGGDGTLEILERAMQGVPDPLDRLAHDVPGELVAICEKAMERAPGRRYESMMAMAEDLRAYLEQRVVGAYETGAVAEFRKWVARNKGMAASIAIAIGVAIAGLAGVSYVQAKGRSELAVANTDLETANESLTDANLALEAAKSLAEANEERALGLEAEARWQSYRANVSAASVLLDQGVAGGARSRLADCPEQHRGWEWHFLDKLSDSSLRVLEGHDEFSSSVAYSPDGRLVASGGGGPQERDHTTRIWDTATGKELHRLEGHAQDVISLAFSPGGTELVSAGNDVETVLWDVETGEELGRVSQVAGFLAYHPDARRVFIGGGSSGQIFEWDTYEDRVSVLPVRMPARIECIRFFPDGRRLAVGCTDFHVRIVDIEARRIERDIDVLDWRPDPPVQPELGNGVMAIDVDPEMNRLLTGSSDGSLLAWNLESGEVEVVFEGHRGGVRSAHFHPSGRWVISSSMSMPVRFWDAESGLSLEILHGHEKWTIGSTVSPRGDQIATCSLDGTVRLWDGQPGSNVRTLSQASTSKVGTRFLAFSPDGERLAWTPDETHVHVSEVQTGETLFALPAFKWTVRELGFDPSGEVLFTVSAQGHAMRWDGRTGELLATSSVTGPTTAVALNLETGRYAVARGESEDVVVAIHSAETFERVREWELPPEALPSPDEAGAGRAVQDLSFSDDGRLLVTFTGARTIGVWEVETGALVRAITSPVSTGVVTLDPQARRLVLTNSFLGNAISFVDLETGELIAELGGHGNLMTVSPFSSDGERIATGSADGTVSMWHPERGELTTLGGSGEVTAGSAGIRDAVVAVEISPDMRCVASLRFDGTCKLWDVASPLELAEARQAAARRQKWAAEAESRVYDLSFRFFLPGDVVRELERDASLDHDLREACIRAARSSGIDPEQLIGKARFTAYQSEATPARYVRALEAVQFVLRIWPGTEEFLGVLGAAHYRMGNYEEALVALEGSAAFWSARQNLGVPLDWIFLAMTHERLGNDAEAMENLRTARRVFSSLSMTPPERMVLTHLMQEAEEVVTGD